jgi:hypothetical protein
MRVSFPPSIRVGSLIRTTHASILWKEGAICLVTQVDRPMLSYVWALFPDGSRRRMGAHSVEVIA